FSDAGFEITEAERREVARNEAPPGILAHLEPAPETASARLSDLAAPPATAVAHFPSLNLDDIEIEVRFALHHIDADLGEPVEVEREDGARVVVNAWSASPARQAELTALLGRKAHVAL